jgi:predicted helicase
LEKENVRYAEYRPFFKQHVYLGEKLIHRRGQFDEFVPEHIKDNRILCVPGIGVNKEFTCKVTDIIPDLEIGGKTQCFPLYYYEKRKLESPGIFDQLEDSEYIQRDGISDYVFDLAKNQYGGTVSKEDIFYYVYGYLHSPEYRESFTNDLKKMLPRLPLVEDVRDFWNFSKLGRELAELHINYETLPLYDGVTITGSETEFYAVEKMRFTKKDQKDTILFNSKITVSNIPENAYEYVINGKSAIEWIMERYQTTIHKESGIRNDPNDWAKEVGNPRYILDLLLRVINVSVKTVEIVTRLPSLNFEEVTKEADTV